MRDVEKVMAYYFEHENLDVSGLFTTLKGCIAAAEGVSDKDKEAVKVYAQTSDGDRLVGKTAEYVGDLTIWCFDYDYDWPFARE